MARTKYFYNPRTLRYERARLSVVNVALSFIAVLSFGAVFFLGLFVLQNYLVNTPAEKALHEENKALREHKVVLTRRLYDAQEKLDVLSREEEKLYTKFFDLALEKKTSAKFKEILVADLPNFDSTVARLNHVFANSQLRALRANLHYHQWASVHKDDLEKIAAFPGAVPVENMEPKMLVSGFGTRINPWHKGKYHHDGVDIAGARGTAVLATGHGRVIAIKKSDLQAGFGNYLEIDHGYGFVTRYTHLGEMLVKVGQKIKKGDVIARMGVSGGSIAPHVHYEVLKDGKNIDPLKIMVEGIGSNQFDLLATAARQLNQSLD
jgi:murein DD-endopeptidase MepM/ murein hydrolase activator NlpD